MTMKKIAIAGAGPVGCLAAVYLAKRGYDITIFERRPDMRHIAISAGRSINLALSVRGIRGLEGAGIADDVMRIAIPMGGRMLHGLSGEQRYQPYGAAGQAINSVSRREINVALLDCAERLPNIKVIFDRRCTDIDLENTTITTEDSAGNSYSFAADVIIGADGAYSAVRDRMQRTDRFDYEQSHIEHGYKELTIPALPDGGFPMEKHALHIWPRGKFMLIALPNMDGSFTCTLFFPFEGDPSFATLTTPDAVRAFFSETFPDAVPLMPTLVEDFFRNPTSSLMTVRCFPWAYHDKVLLIGDAAHAIVPFFGQGMNAGFEDCTVLNECLDEFGDDLGTVFSVFQQRRKANADAILRLALDNFVEMRDKVADPAFLDRKTVERLLHEHFPDRFTSLYSMVSFSHVPYAEALRQGHEQEALIDRAIAVPGMLDNPLPSAALEELRRIVG